MARPFLTFNNYPYKRIKPQHSIITMKVYHSNSAFGTQRLNKVKAVAALTGADIHYENNEKAAVLQTLFRPTFPVIETPEGALHSSNTIIRYLANRVQKFYGTNIHETTLVDQWLDITAFELEPSISALTSAVEGTSNVVVFKAWEDAEKFIKCADNYLSKHTCLVGSSLTIADVSLFVNVSALFQYAYDAKKRGQYANLVRWYEAVAKELGDKIPTVTLCEKTHENLSCTRGDQKESKPKDTKKDDKKDDKKGGKPVEKKAAKEEEDIDLFGDDDKKEQKKDVKKDAKKDDDDIDLFGDDDKGQKKEKETVKPAPPPPKKEKKKGVAKSIVIFDVKVYEEETDLNALGAKIFAQINPEGLVWNKDFKILPVAYTMKKLQMGCVVEDEKVSTDDIFEQIESWEDVQSTDIVSFQKL